MTLNRRELKKIMSHFNSFASRLLQASIDDYSDVLKKFLYFLNSQELIMNFINSCGICQLDMEEEVNLVACSFGRYIFTTGETNEEEVCNVYATLKYIVDHNVDVSHNVAMGYTSSTKYKDGIKAFNERFVLILIRHIENYLTDLGIDMGIDESKNYNITNTGQIIVASENAVVDNSTTVYIDQLQLRNIISDIRDISTELDLSDNESLTESLDVIETEVNSHNPKKSLIKTAIKTLKGLGTSAEYLAAIAALVEFLKPLIG